MSAGVPGRHFRPAGGDQRAPLVPGVVVEPGGVQVVAALGAIALALDETDWLPGKAQAQVK